MASKSHQRREADLVASEIAHANSLLDQADVAGSHSDTRLLFNAADSLLRTKNLLSVITLEPEQAARFEQELAVIRARLLGKQ